MRQKIEQCSIFPASTRAVWTSAEYIFHVFELGVDARSLNEPQATTRPSYYTPPFYLSAIDCTMSDGSIGDVLFKRPDAVYFATSHLV
jgi:hypothetical protein